MEDAGSCAIHSTNVRLPFESGVARYFHFESWEENVSRDLRFQYSLALESIRLRIIL